MQPESLGEYAVTLDFMKVNVQLIHGQHVERENVIDAIFDTESPSILYQTVGSVLFDRADIDEAIVREIKRLTVNSDRTQMNSLKAGASVAKNLLSGDFSNAQEGCDGKSKRLESLLNEQIPTLLEWDIDGENPIRVADFVQHQVPFQKTREWLFDRMTEIVQPQSDRFLSRITIKSGSVYAIQ